MQARILPGRGRGARRRTSDIGSAWPSRARRSSVGRSRSKPSMTPVIVAVGVAPLGTASARLTTPRSVKRPGNRSGFPEIWNVTSFTVPSPPHLGSSCPQREAPYHPRGSPSTGETDRARSRARGELCLRAMTRPATRAAERRGGRTATIGAALAGEARAAEESPTKSTELEAELPTAPVVIDGNVLFRVRGTSAFPADRRAAGIAERIAALAADPTVSPDGVHPVEIELGTAIV